jgi:hypothetical protein
MELINLFLNWYIIYTGIYIGYQFKYLHYRTLTFMDEIIYIYIYIYIAGYDPTLPTLCVCRFESRWRKKKQCVSTNYNLNTIGLNVQTSNIYLNNIFKHIFIDELHITFFFTIQYNIGFRNKRNAYINPFPKKKHMKNWK